MATQTEVVNKALTLLKQARALSIDDDNDNAATMRSLWNLTRDTEMSAHPWSFAIKRLSIPASVDVPAFGYGFAYPLPAADYLSMVEVGEHFVLYGPYDPTLFQIEGAAILTDEPSPLRIRYVYRVENVGAWPALFSDALACRLAHQACMRVTGDKGLKDSIAQDYLLAIKTAKRANIIQKPPQQIPDNDSWWLARI